MVPALALIFALLCFFGFYIISLINDVILIIKDSKPSPIPTNSDGKSEYNEIEIYSNWVKDELKCFIKYSYSGQLVRENEMYEFLFDLPQGQVFKFYFSEMTGYI